MTGQGGGAGWLGATRHDLDTVASTQLEALALARAGAAHGTVVTARRQQAGRGRRDRVWSSPPGGLYFSCVLRPAVTPDRIPPISLAAGIAVCDLVRSLGVTGAQLKWPNDVLVGRAKVAGILAEATARGGAIEWVILGIGINIAQRTFSPAIASQATSLVLQGAKEVAPLEIVTPLCTALEPWLDALFDRGIEAIAGAWTERADLSRLVRAESRHGRVCGHCVGLDATGALIIEDQAGARHTIAAGDVTVD
ncbi:MAG TPA: biotin--[acetyl-CoA-carboxylase] ligase [Kofleriaceae bacterium]|nr:biotin--[acetyl-CoA-carboxylase] ligase [Kofleriaceae bacterium]